MGKTGTTNGFRDALFVGSTYGLDGITVAVRIGFDDNRSLGPRETGSRVALPVFQELMLKVYRDAIVGPAPAFPNQMEQRITQYVQADAAAPVVQGDAAAPLASAARPLAASGIKRRNTVPAAELEWILHHTTILVPLPTPAPALVPLNPIRRN
jgi:membrane carboxypeptidase/penicillin-binding protein